MKLKVSVIQMGAYPGDYDKNLEKAVALFEKAAKENAPDIVLFSEMMTVPYFGGVREDRYFQYAEPRDGKVITTFARKAKELNTHVIVTWFEREDGGPGGKPRYFNSAGFVSPDKGLTGVYRKVHLPKVESANLITDEKYYFSEGEDFPIFNIKGVDFGILICYDRSFPESWRTLWLKGAKVVFLSVATYGFRRAFFLKELEVRAAENHIFVVAANKAGNESVENEKLVRDHFGYSCVIDPYGNIMSKLESESFDILTETIDLEIVDEANRLLDWKRDRSPELYGIITSP